LGDRQQGNRRREEERIRPRQKNEQGKLAQRRKKRRESFARPQQEKEVMDGRMVTQRQV
jgi:hypothetical protein